MEKPVVNMVDISLQRIKEMVDVNTIIGDAITTPDGMTIIPVSKVSFGFGSGGSEFGSKQANGGSNFGGGVGSGVTITPIAFLVIGGGDVKLLNLDGSNNPTTPIEWLIEAAPIAVEKIGSFFKERRGNE